jgi:hypothetical protein
MKKLIIAIVLLVVSIAAEAQDRKVVASLKCTATAYRTAGEDNSENTSILWFLVVKKGEKLSLEEYGGHIYVTGYYGLFNGKNLVEVPYTRPVKYKNHYRFKFTADYTDGNESGMSGDFVLNKEIDGSRDNSNFETDAHYVFQAGDHLGGTIDYSCVNKL